MNARYLIGWALKDKHMRDNEYLESLMMMIVWYFQYNQSVNDYHYFLVSSLALISF